MKLCYYADDGGIEIAAARDIVIEEAGRCYHCERWMYVGDGVVELTDSDGFVYVLHRKCFERNTGWTE